MWVSYYLNNCSWTQGSIVGRLIKFSFGRSYRFRFALQKAPKELRKLTLIIITVIRRKHFLLKHKFLRNDSFTSFLQFEVEKFVMGTLYNKFLETLRYIDGIIEDVCSSGHTLSSCAQAIGYYLRFYCL